jgi:hypothetical protein
MNRGKTNMAVPKVDSSLFPADHRAGRSSFKRNKTMKHTQGKWNVKEVRENLNGLSSFVSYQVVSDDEVVIAKETTEANANLIESAPEMLELLKDILVEVRPEISRVNEAAGRTIFNPVATETIDMAKELIAKAEGK